MKGKSLVTLMLERQNQRRLLELRLHPNRKLRGVVTRGVDPLPPELAEEAGPETGLPLALAGLVDREFLATAKWQEQQKRANREGAHPKVLKYTDAVIRRFARIGIPMFAHCIVRTPGEQARLYREGKSKDSPEDGMWPHKGCAVDLVHSTKGWNLNKEEWALIGHLGQEVSDQLGCGMEWGGSWHSFYDPAHWQFRKWKTVIGEYPWPKM